MTMQIPHELLWGVDVAVKKLRPGANFQLEGTRFTQWSCPTTQNRPRGRKSWRNYTSTNKQQING